MLNKENKSQIITQRMTKSELKELDEKARRVKLTRSAYINRKLNGLSVLPTRVPAINWKLYGELSTIASQLPAIGNNINQIAKALNTAALQNQSVPSSLPSPETLSETVELIEEVKTLVKEVRLGLSGVKTQK